MKMRQITFKCLSATSCFVVLSYPPKNLRVHPNASVSSPMGAGHKDLLCDWVRTVAQQGGVKPAGMFHIHTQREYIISPSGHCVLSGL